MSPLELSAFLTLSAISGIAVTTLFGHLHDKKPVMWPLLLSLLAKIAGYVFCVVLTDTLGLLLVAFVLFGLSSASFALVFAMAKGYLDQVGGEAVLRGMASLRMTASISWAIGPALGAGLVALWSFEGVFVGAAMLAVLALATVLISRIKMVPAATEKRQKITLEVVRAAAPQSSRSGFSHRDVHGLERHVDRRRARARQRNRCGAAVQPVRGAGSGGDGPVRRCDRPTGRTTGCCSSVSCCSRSISRWRCSGPRCSRSTWGRSRGRPRSALSALSAWPMCRNCCRGEPGSRRRCSATR